MRSALPATYAMATAGSILAMPTTVRERWTARRAAASYGRRARTCAIPPTRRSPSVCRKPALCISKACKARACGKTGPATRRRSRAISSATSTNPRMTRRGERSATSRSNARASRRLAPASLRRQPRPPFCRPAPPRRRRSSPAHRVRRPRLLARRLQNPRGRRRHRQSRPGRRLRPSPAAPIRCAASALALASRAARDPRFRSAANVASSASSQPAAPARIQAARWERRRSGPAISAATAVKSIPAPAACRHAAPARSSMANVSRLRSRTVRRDRRPRVALSAPPAMCRPAAPVASQAK